MWPTGKRDEPSLARRAHHWLAAPISSGLAPPAGRANIIVGAPLSLTLAAPGDRRSPIVDVWLDDDGCGAARHRAQQASAPTTILASAAAGESGTLTTKWARPAESRVSAPAGRAEAVERQATDRRTVVTRLAVAFAPATLICRENAAAASRETPANLRCSRRWRRAAADSGRRSGARALAACQPTRSTPL